MTASRSNLARERALQVLLQVLDDGLQLETALDTVWPLAADPPPAGPDDYGSKPGPDAGARPALSATGNEHGGPGSRDRALTQAICFGVLRWLPLLRAITGVLLTRPFKARDRDVEVALLIGLHQIDYLRIPPHAAVSSAVELTRFRRKRWASAVVNGCLRRYLRERTQIHRQLESSPEVRHAHPGWLYSQIQADWPDQASAIFEANQQRAPMTLRVNTCRQSRDAYLTKLGSAGLNAAPCRHTNSGIKLAAPAAVSTLPGFEAGAVSVQDEAAQLAAALLAPASGARVLDACAAPGGKSAHLLEAHPQLGELICLDSSANRLERLELNLNRLHLNTRATITQGKAEAPADWWDGTPFGAILVDAPCTATGVVRRHPDIKVLRRPGDAAAASKTQRAIVHALWSLLVPGGRLLYATCSILRAENDAVVQSLITSQAAAVVRRIDADWGITTACGRQILPGADDMDGFYYALIEKRGA